MDDCTQLRQDQIAMLTKPGLASDRLVALVETLLLVAYLKGRVDCAESQLEDLTAKRREYTHAS
jgi:hypothetical protein